jgi:hypoxanthine phosphoribosyltransferase
MPKNFFENNLVLQSLLPEETIRQRVAEMGREITDEYQGEEILLIGVLRGAVIFLGDLARSIHLPLRLDFISISSYGAGMQSTSVRILKDLDEDISNTHVIVVEGIVDTGLTLSYLLGSFRPRRPRSLKVCTLLNKPARRIVDVPIDYVGFEIPDRFVVGYGLDYNQRYRNLPAIYALVPPSERK